MSASTSKSTCNSSLHISIRNGLNPCSGRTDFRNQIFLTKKDEISRIKGIKLNFWKFFTKIITSPLVIGSLLTLYNKYLLKRFGDSMKDMIFYPNLMLIHDKANYSLGPHTDISNKVIVILIYLESDNETNSTDSYGTSIYIPKEIGFTCEGDKHHKHKDFFKIYTSSFKRNNSFSFFRTNNSFHGVETISDKPIKNDLLFVNSNPFPVMYLLFSLRLSKKPWK